MSTKERKRDPDLVGFYCDIPKELKAEFDQMFPAKGAKRTLITAVLETIIKEEKDARDRRSE